MELDVFDLAKTVSIQEAMEPYIQLRRKGQNYLALCPFHNDKHLGSFVVNPARGKFRCYACGKGGDGTDFVSEVCGISPLEAAVRIAMNAGLLTAAEAENVLSRKHGRPRKIQTARQLPKQELLLSEKANPLHIEKVYRCFARAADALLPEYKKHLLEVRKVHPGMLTEYFTFPERKDEDTFWPKFREELAKAFHQPMPEMQDKLLLGVPGFFVGKDGRMHFSAPKDPSLGIIIRDRNRNISGIQLRNMAENIPKSEMKQKRYKFLSSGFADGTPNSVGAFGTNCGFVEDVVYPTKPWNHEIALTEGRFKAASLSRLGYLVVNMHSINNWEPASKVALALAKKYPPKRFLLVYDAENTEPVLRSAHQMESALEGTRPIWFAIWHPKFGKGFDDVVNAGFLKKTRAIPSDMYFQMHEKAQNQPQ